MAPARVPPPTECANCGASIPRTARACPECGADERTGWRDSGDTDYASLDLPDSAYDDGDRPLAPRPSRQVNGLAWYWWVVGVSLLLFLGLGALRLL